MMTLNKITCAFALAIIAGSQSVAQQLTLQTDYLEVCQWNGKASKFEECNAYPLEGIFEFNAQQTQVRHLTGEATATYSIRETKYEAENDLYEYQVVNANGIRFILIRDGRNNLIKILAKTPGSKKSYVLLSHHIAHQMETRPSDPVVPVSRTLFRQ